MIIPIIGALAGLALLRKKGIDKPEPKPSVYIPGVTSHLKSGVVGKTVNPSPSQPKTYVYLPPSYIPREGIQSIREIIGAKKVAEDTVMREVNRGSMDILV